LIALYDQVEPAPEIGTNVAATAGCAGARMQAPRAVSPLAAASTALTLGPRTKSSNRVNGMGGR
jgi:hypothetical protein